MRRKRTRKRKNMNRRIFFTYDCLSTDHIRFYKKKKREIQNLNAKKSMWGNISRLDRTRLVFLTKKKCHWNRST